MSLCVEGNAFFSVRGAGIRMCLGGMVGEKKRENLERKPVGIP